LRNGAPPDEGLTPGERARIWARLEGGSRPSRALAGLRWSVAATVLLASAGVLAGATTQKWWPVVTRTSSTPSLAPGARAPHARRAAAVPSRPEPVAVPAAQEPQPATAPQPAVIPSSRAAELPKVKAARAAAGHASAAPSPIDDAAAASTPEPATPPSALALETSLLGEALTRLRQRRDARGALETLDIYDARFPLGALRREADGTRVDALLLLGHEAEALAVLRRLSLEPRGRDQELRVIRAELLAATSCHEAVTDFDRVLAESPPPALAERALHGRAACLTQTGDAAGAARDLREYLRRFPDGRFAAEARRLLEESNL
jgi:tetratricopeptide (TPR) repeat protein